MDAASLSDEQCIGQTLKLARRAAGRTSPNPMVGALLVKDGKVLGRGYHKRAGRPHAEIEAMQSARTNLAGAALYVNLEPCVHYGRTPPCADAIIRAGIKHVVCSTLDPNPQVAGRGVARLKRAGIRVSVGSQKEAARALNEAYFTYHEKHRPFVALKFAASLDGKLATRTNDSKWITNDAARTYARSLRARYQAILVGIGTVLHDDPHLGTRSARKPDPKRIILDSRLRIPLQAQVLRDSNAIVATTSRAPADKLYALKRRGIEVLVFDGGEVPLGKLMVKLRQAEIISLLVEGGGTVLGNFIDQKLADKVYAFYAPLLIGGQDAVSISGQGAGQIQGSLDLDRISTKRFQDNILITGTPHYVIDQNS